MPRERGEPRGRVSFKLDVVRRGRVAVILAGRFRRNHAHDALETNQSSAHLLDINAASGLQSARLWGVEGMRRRRGENCGE